jgi:cytochrome c553
MHFLNTYQKWLLPIFGALAILALLGLWNRTPDDPTLPERVDFNYHIRPILSQNCYVCHGPDSSSREAGLRLDHFAGATARLDGGGAAVVPGRPGRSLLLQRVKASDPSLVMPPPEAKKTLSTREIALLERWIDQGAEWKPHWAFIKPKRSSLPDRLREGSVPEKIDHFIQKELQFHDLKASEPASKNQLIRRVSYLLTGLPPAPQDLSRFLADTSAEAYAKIVDYYLASPHFGERWARHWMDLVRYGESMGHEGDFNISHAFEYRDYLIRAFNQDVPYDLLVKEHLAGDMLDQARFNPQEGFNESRIGTAYFFLGEGKHSPVSLKLEEADKIDNMIDVTAKTFQGLTVACARCHDHKFDPIPTTDYYAMYGMIESARLGPLPARLTRQQEQKLAELKGVKSTIREELGQVMMRQLSEASAAQKAQFVRKQGETVSIPEKTRDYQVIGDFRRGTWEGWYADGWAFGEAPLMGEPEIDVENGQITGLNSGFASSRAYGPGIHGALRSPNFIIETDSLAIRARGLKGQIRVVVENFQVIQAPLYGGYQVTLNDPAWKTYYFDLNLARGRKAYLQFTPGNYGRGGRHVYTLQPEDYIEVQYAVAFRNGVSELPLPAKPVFGEAPFAHRLAVKNWIEGKMNLDDVPLLEESLAQVRHQMRTPSLTQLIGQYRQLNRQLYDSTHFIGLTEGEAVFSPVFERGSVDQPGDEPVPHGFLQAINAGPKPYPQQGSGRLAWAEAVVDPDNPLTARVIVNRLWHHVFGRGIVETVDNFGLQGHLPSHPELLDFLALQMMEEAWSMKSMLRHFLLTETFRRSTQVLASNQKRDPENVYLHHFPLRRLEAEAIRDGILAVSGSLDSAMYGPSVPVHLTPFMTGRGRPGVSGPLDGNGRRSIYTAVRRNFISPMMLAFDMPIPFSTFGKRNTTNVPAQSLTLLNDPFVHEQAETWAEKLLHDPELSSLEARVQTIYLQAFSRPASREEIHLAEAFMEDHAALKGQAKSEMLADLDLWANYCHTVINLKEFIHLL